MSYETVVALSDGRRVRVEYLAQGGSKAVTSGPPEHCDPGELPEVTIQRVCLEDDEEAEICLSVEEDARLSTLIGEEHEYPDWADDYFEEDWL